MLNWISKMSNQMPYAHSEKQMKINMSVISDRILIRSTQDNGKRNQVLAKTDCRSSTIILESLDLCLHQHCHWASRLNRVVLECDAGTLVRPSGDLCYWPDLPTGDWSHPRHRDPDLESPTGSSMAWQPWHTPRIACNLTQSDDERSPSMTSWIKKCNPGTPWVRLKTPLNRGSFIHSHVAWWSFMAWSPFLWCWFLNGWRTARSTLILRGHRLRYRCGQGPGARCRNFVSLPWQWQSWGFWHAKWCCSTTRWTAGTSSQLAYSVDWEDEGFVKIQGVNSIRLLISIAN